MTVTEEYLRLITEVKGDQALADVQKKLQDVAKEEANLKSLYQQNAIAEDLLEKETRRLAAAKAELTGVSKGLKGGFDLSNQSLLTLGQSFQDFQAAGLMGVSNNLDRLVMMLGGPAGLAAVTMVVGAAFLAFKPQLAQMAKDFGLFGGDVEKAKDHLERLDDRIKEIEKEPVKLAVDLVELQAARKEVEDIKAALAAVDKLRKTRASAEKESGKQIDDAVAEAPGGGKAVADVLKSQMVWQLADSNGPLREARAEQAAAREKVEALKRDAEKANTEEERTAAEGLRAHAQAELDAAREKAQKALAEITRAGGEADQKAGDLYRRATEGTGVEQRRAQEDLARRMRDAGRGDVADAVEAAAPERVEEDYRVDDAQQESIERQKAGRKARDERAKAKEKRDREWGAEAERELTDWDRDEGKEETDTQKRVREARKLGNALAEDAEKPRKDPRLAEAERSVPNLAANEARAMQSQGATAQAAAAAAQRSIELQGQGWPAFEAQSQALNEAVALAEKMFGRYEQLRQHAQLATRQLRQVRDAMGDNADFLLNNGGIP